MKNPYLTTMLVAWIALAIAGLVTWIVGVAPSSDAFHHVTAGELGAQTVGGAIMALAIAMLGLWLLASAIVWKPAPVATEAAVEPTAETI